MTHYTIDILKSDFSYVVEAIRMRGYALADQIAAQALKQEQAKQQNTWTVTAKGNDLVAVNKSTGLKRSPEAPYGYKKDGTPKSRPGRKSA